jgi:hypothetical protein
VLCDQETYEACNASASCGCSWNVLDSIEVKGKAEPVAIFQPVGQALSRDSTHSRSRSKGAGMVSSAHTPTKRARSATNTKVALFGTYGRAGEKRKLEQLLLDLVVRGHGSLLLIPPSISLYTSIYTSLYTSIYTSICLHLPPGARPRLAARAAR